jgi:hypothetical protein
LILYSIEEEEEEAEAEDARSKHMVSGGGRHV